MRSRFILFAAICLAVAMTQPASVSAAWAQSAFPGLQTPPPPPQDVPRPVVGSAPAPLPPGPPTDPTIYRFYELVQVYGTTWKELIHEEFGDGIMSAIDFNMTMERLPDPKGDRVKIVMTGKFLDYKRY